MPEIITDVVCREGRRYAWLDVQFNLYHRKTMNKTMTRIFFPDGPIVYVSRHRVGEFLKNWKISDTIRDRNRGVRDRNPAIRDNSRKSSSSISILALSIAIAGSV